VFGGGQLGNRDETVTRNLIEYYLAQGGNVIDTAEIYGFFGKSEAWLGRYLKDGGHRENLVISTKFGVNTGPESVNGGGLGRKNLLRALEGSLRRIQSEYIDLYWVHTWDTVTPVEEVVATMDHQVRCGKIRFYGFSNTPAWYVANACALAETRGQARPIALQMQYSLLERTIEYEYIAMARALGLGLFAWSPLADGFLSGKYRRVGDSFEGEGKLDNQRKAGFSHRRQITERHWRILSVLTDVAGQMGVPPAHVALSWVFNRPGVTAPILGASSAAQMEDNLRGLALKIPDEFQMRLDEATAPPAIYPYEMFAPKRLALMDPNFTVRAGY
jgi:aryl-alcohol dehydrogenase-like predicted oxidoreductase